MHMQILNKCFGDSFTLTYTKPTHTTKNSQPVPGGLSLWTDLYPHQNLCQETTTKPQTSHQTCPFYWEWGFLQPGLGNQWQGDFLSPKISAVQLGSLQTFQEASPGNVGLSLIFSELEKSALSRQNKAGRRRNCSSRHQPSAPSPSNY